MINALHDLVVPTTIRPRGSILAASAAISATTLRCYISFDNQTADWVLEAAKKLDALRRLRPNWDSYGGVPLKQGTKELTLRVLDWLGEHDLPVPAVVLGSGGTVQLGWRKKGKELEVELRENNTIEYVKVSSTGDIEEGETEANISTKVRDLIRWLIR